MGLRVNARPWRWPDARAHAVRQSACGRLAALPDARGFCHWVAHWYGQNLARRTSPTGDDLDLVDDRRVQREGSAAPTPKETFADGEGLADPP